MNPRLKLLRDLREFCDSHDLYPGRIVCCQEDLEAHAYFFKKPKHYAYIAWDEDSNEAIAIGFKKDKTFQVLEIPKVNPGNIKKLIIDFLNHGVVDKDLVTYYGYLVDD